MLTSLSNSAQISPHFPTRSTLYPILFLESFPTQFVLPIYCWCLASCWSVVDLGEN